MGLLLFFGLIAGGLCSVALLGLAVFINHKRQGKLKLKYRFIATIIGICGALLALSLLGRTSQELESHDPEGAMRVAFSLGLSPGIAIMVGLGAGHLLQPFSSED